MNAASLRRLDERGLRRAAQLAVLAAVVGVFGTWRSSGPVSLDGVQGPHDGWLAFLFALIALAGIRSLARGGWLGIVLVLGCAAAIVSFAVRALADDGDVLGGGSGWGVWLTLVAGSALAALAALRAYRRLRR